MGGAAAREGEGRMKALVTGVSGFVGRALAKALIERGDEVRGFARGSYPELEEMGVEMIRGDLSDAASVDQAVEGVDIVFHAGARVEIWGDYEPFYETNVTGTENVINACQANGVKKLVYTSTPSVVFGPGSSDDGVDESVPYPDSHDAAYPATKAIAEQAVLAADGEQLSTTALRPHLIWGPGDTHSLPTTVKKARTGRLRWPGEPQKVDTCYIDNCVHAHLLAADQLEPGADCAGKAYFITQDEPVSALKFANDLLATAGVDPIDKTVPLGIAKLGAAVIDVTWKTLRLKSEPPIHSYQVNMMSKPHWYDISAAKEDLGYVPLVSYDEGMKRLEEWVKENPL
jgi:nucleoside-diphosphate-sugar epimerase